MSLISTPEQTLLLVKPNSWFSLIHLLDDKKIVSPPKESQISIETILILHPALHGEKLE